MVLILFTSWWKHCVSSLFFSLTICPNPLLLLEGPPNYIHCPLTANSCEFLLVDQHWLIQESDSNIERHLRVSPSFSSSDHHVLIIFRLCFLRWEVSGHTAVAFFGGILLPGIIPNRPLWNNKNRLKPIAWSLETFCLDSNCIVSCKVGDRNREWPEWSLFNSYCTEV